MFIIQQHNNPVPVAINSTPERWKCPDSSGRHSTSTTTINHNFSELMCCLIMQDIHNKDYSHNIKYNTHCQLGNSVTIKHRKNIERNAVCSPYLKRKAVNMTGIMSYNFPLDFGSSTTVNGYLGQLPFHSSQCAFLISRAFQLAEAGWKFGE